MRVLRPFVLVTVRGAAFLGIGAMVGAGIFALLGEAAIVAGSVVWLSFLLAGVVSALLAPETFAAILGIALLAVIFDLVWKRIRGVAPSSAPQAA